MQLSTNFLKTLSLTTLFKETMSNLFSSFLIVCILRPWIIWSCIRKWYRDSTFTFHEAIYLFCTSPSQIFLVTLKLLEKISSRDSFTLQSSTLDNLEQHKHRYLNLLCPRCVGITSGGWLLRRLLRTSSCSWSFSTRCSWCSSLRARLSSTWTFSGGLDRTISFSPLDINTSFSISPSLLRRHS